MKKGKGTFSNPPKFSKLLGPSFVILALGLGSGEVILWPFLTSKYALGIAWGALLGITFQYFMNMEIERYTLVKGESVFVGLNDMFKWAPYWFIGSTFIGFGIPGIIAASAKVASHLVGFADHRWIAIGFLGIVGLILSSGKTVYGMMEKITKTVILIGAPFILIIALLLAKASDWGALGKGLIGIGESLVTQPEGYFFLPLGISLVTFLAAFAYAGAGGNLNLTQSIYVKEKGYGMGKYSQKMSGLFRSKKDEKINLRGVEAGISKENVKAFKKWWKAISLEHLIVFWFIGLVTMSLLMLLSYVTAFKIGGAEGEGIQFVISEGVIIGQSLFPWIGILFLIAVVIMLFQTQLGVLDSTSRIMAENLALKKLENKKTSKINLSKIYYIFLWAQIAFGVFLFLINFTEPLTLIIIGAVINAVGMFVHIGMVNWMNIKKLPKEYRPRIWRRLVMLGIFLFFGFFSLVTIFSQIGKFF